MVHFFKGGKFKGEKGQAKKERVQFYFKGEERARQKRAWSSSVLGGKN